MTGDRQNPWVGENEVGMADLYLDKADLIVVERQLTIQLLGDLFGYHFPEPRGLHLLDLGCGDGVLSGHLDSRFPGNHFVLLDAAPSMLDRARKRLGTASATFIRQSFEEYLDSPAGRCDFAYSANAIHHLDLPDKQRLFSSLHQALRPGGLFIVIDPVRPTSARSEDLQFRMWTSWIDENLRDLGRPEEVGGFEAIPQRYKQAPENRPDTLGDQLKALEDAGFADVDCFYKHGVFAVFGGSKP